MDSLLNWSERWNVPSECMADLVATLNAAPTVAAAPAEGTMSEAAVKQRVTLTGADEGRLLWRNNVGVAFNREGTPVRYGLANESKGMNTLNKSSDLIGITPYTVKPEDIGRVLGIFTAFEVKHENWSWSGSEHEVGQKNYLLLVANHGGLAAFITDPNVLPNGDVLPRIDSG